VNILKRSVPWTLFASRQSARAFQRRQPEGAVVSAVGYALSTGKRPWFYRFAPLVVVLVLHAAGVWLALQFESTRAQVGGVPPPLMVSLIAPPEIVPPQPQLPKPRSDPVDPPTLKRLAAKPVDNVPELNTVPQQPMPPIEAALVPTQVPPAPIAAPPLPITPPNFNVAYLDNPPPVYPAISRRMGEWGTVLLRVYVSGGGHAEKVEIKASSGSQRLDGAAMEAVRQWQFVPAKQGDQAVAAWVLVPISFNLKG